MSSHHTPRPPTRSLSRGRPLPPQPAEQRYGGQTQQEHHVRRPREQSRARDNTTNYNNTNYNYNYADSDSSRYSDADVHSLYDTDAVYGGSVLGDESRTRRRNEVDGDNSGSESGSFNDSTLRKEDAPEESRHYQKHASFDAASSARTRSDAYSDYYPRPPARLEERSSMGSTVRDRDSVATEKMPPSPQSAASPSRYHANNFPIPPSNYSPASITSTQRQLPPRSNTISNTLPLPTTTSAALLSPSASPTFVIPSSPRTTSHPVDVYRTPPSKIIKAMSEYTAKTPSELSFVAGDFFYVVSESHPDFFEVVNPAAKLRGHVPRNYFESLEKAGQRFSAEQRSKRVEENRTYANPSPNGSYGSGSSANGRATGSPALRIPPSPDSYATPPYGTPPRSAKSPGRSPEGLRSPSSVDSFHPPPRTARSRLNLNVRDDKSNDGGSIMSRSLSAPRGRKGNDNGPSDSINFGINTPARSGKSPGPPLIRQPKQLPVPPVDQFINPPMNRNMDGDYYVPPPRTITNNMRRGDDSSPTTPLQRMAAASLGVGSPTQKPQQFQNLSRSQSHGHNLSTRQGHQPPLPSHSHRNSPSTPVQQSTDIQKILVPSHRQFQDIRYYYRIHVQYSASRTEILYRTHDDFWALQVSLLNFFPTESGRSNNRPRIIPFLPAPTLNARDVSARVAQSLQKRLEKYLQELIFMPQHIQASAMWVKFFQVRRGSNVFDIEYPTQEDLEAPSGIESVTSLLNEYTVNESTILVRIARGGKANQSTDLFAMEVAQDITFNELLDEVERRYGARIEGLDYFDESGFLVPMYGDSDLGVLVRTNSEDLRFLIVL